MLGATYESIKAILILLELILYSGVRVSRIGARYVCRVEHLRFCWDFEWVVMILGPLLD